MCRRDRTSKKESREKDLNAAVSAGRLRSRDRRSLPNFRTSGRHCPFYNGVGVVKRFLVTPPPPRAGRGVKGAPRQRGVISTLDAAPGPPTMERGRSGVRRTKLRPRRILGLVSTKARLLNPAVGRSH